jgi:hypothetical protein
MGRKCFANRENWGFDYDLNALLNEVVSNLLSYTEPKVVFGFFPKDIYHLETRRFNGGTVKKRLSHLSSFQKHHI